MSLKIPVILEVGKKKVFASALEWPGWARSAKSEKEALETLLAYGPRYKKVVSSIKIGFNPPKNLAAFKAIEKLKGDATTDFGVPGVTPSADQEPVDSPTLNRLESILSACWKSFVKIVKSAEGKQLRKGPRGGGRTTFQILDHVIEAHYSYLRMIYWREQHEKTKDINYLIKNVNKVDQEALKFATSDKMPETGPRGGKLWTPRYFVRRAVWHILDHAWEIEDRLGL